MQHEIHFFSLVVDEVGLKYTPKNNALRLIDTVKKKYPGITIDWIGRIFLEIHLYWDYTNRTITLSMPNYINKALSRFKHKIPKHDQDSPHPHATPNYGAKIQYATPSTASNLIESQIIYCQQVIGAFLFYGQAIESTMLTSVGSIVTHLSTAHWDNIKNLINHFLDYSATHLDVKVTHHKIDMHIWVHTDDYYLTETKSRSQARGYH